MKKYLYRIRKFKIKPWIKYWILNKEKTSSGVLSEILTGTSFTLENSLDRLFNKFDLKGNTLQDGEPTPDSPIPIQNVSGNNTIKVQNKNLVKLNSTLNTTRNNVEISYNEQTKKVKFTGTINNTFTYSGTMSLDEPLKPGTYVLSIDGNNRAFMYLRNSQGNVVKNVQTTNPIVTITEEVTSLNFGIEGLSNGATVDIEIGYQLEQGTTATDYVAHEEQNISFPLAQGQKLMEDGTIADGKVINEWGEYVFTGNETFTRDKELTNSYRFYTPSNTIPNSISGTSISTHFKNSTVNSISNIDEQALTVINDNQIVLRINKDIASTVQELKDLLAQWYTNGNPLKVQFHRVTPIEEDFTEEQVTALEALRQAKSYYEQTNISQTNEDLPFIIDLQYWMEEGA